MFNLNENNVSVSSVVWILSKNSMYATSFYDTIGKTNSYDTCLLQIPLNK